MADTLEPSNAATTPWRILCVWLSIGTQSFGGGSAALVRHEAVDRQRWLDDSEFVRYWALCQVTPGINLLGLTVLIGRRVGGSVGVVLALLGLLLPSVAITVVITALYTHFENVPAVKAAVRGVIPATVGVGLATAAKLAVPLLDAGRREGKTSLAVACALLVGGAIAVSKLPVVLVLCAAGAIGGLFQFGRSRMLASGRDTP